MLSAFNQHVNPTSDKGLISGGFQSITFAKVKKKSPLPKGFHNK
jgi:hypothetical protein